MTVRRQHRGETSRLVLRAIQAAGDEVPRHALERHLVDHVVVAIDGAVHTRVQRRAGRQRPQPERHLDLTPKQRPPAAASRPRVAGGVNGQCVSRSRRGPRRRSSERSPARSARSTAVGPLPAAGISSACVRHDAATMLAPSASRRAQSATAACTRQNGRGRDGVEMCSTPASYAKPPRPSAAPRARAVVTLAGGRRAAGGGRQAREGRARR